MTSEPPSEPRRPSPVPRDAPPPEAPPSLEARLRAADPHGAEDVEAALLEEQSRRLALDLEQTGARIERLRLTVAAVAVAAVLVVAAVLWAGGAVTVDPTRRAADELSVPGWAAVSASDEAYGSRWCLGECRVLMRTWTSEGTVDDTAGEYWRAALEAGWVPADPHLCVGGAGEEGCYVRDELYLELWVVPLECEDRYALCVGSEVTAVVAARAALPRLAEDRRAAGGSA